MLTPTPQPSGWDEALTQFAPVLHLQLSDSHPKPTLRYGAQNFDTRVREVGPDAGRARSELRRREFDSLAMSLRYEAGVVQAAWGDN
jgi:hypothetical protein